MGNMTILFTLVWVCNVFAFLAVATVMEINPDNPTILYNCENSVFEDYAVGYCGNKSLPNLQVPDTKKLQDELPDISATGNVVDVVTNFVDGIAEGYQWIIKKIEYIGKIVSGPYMLISMIPALPAIVKGVIGIMWYGLSVFLLIAFMLDRSI